MKKQFLLIMAAGVLSISAASDANAAILESQDFDSGMGDWYAENIRTATNSISSEFDLDGGGSSFKAGPSTCTGNCHDGSYFTNEQAVRLNFDVNDYVLDFDFNVLEHSYGPPDSIGWGERGWVELDGIKPSGGGISPTSLDQWHHYSFSLNQYVLRFSKNKT